MELVGASQGGSSMNARERHHQSRVKPPRPLHDLLLLLPLLAIEQEEPTPDENVAIAPKIDWLGSDAAVVAAIATEAGRVSLAAAHGITAIGHLLTTSAPEIELSDIGAETVEAVGRVLAELGELAALCGYLEASARHVTRDYEPARTTAARPVAVTASQLNRDELAISYLWSEQFYL